MGSGQSSNRYDRDMINQMRKEAYILTGDMTCKRDLEQYEYLKDLSEEQLADEIDMLMVKNKLENGFYDPEFLRALSCVMKLGLTVDKQLTASDYVKHFFTGAKRIGGLSAEGVAMMTGTKGVPSMFVIKAPQNPKADFLVHEYFVASGGTVNGFTIIGTNWLRKVCLNYAQILGAFRCSPPIMDPMSRTLTSWCSTTNPTSFVNYVIYEKVDGSSLKGMIKTISAEEYITTIIQIAYALEIAQLYNGFTHYDLHDDNLIMRPLGSPALIPFVIGESLTVYVESSYVPTIIDFGRCHIQSPAPAAEYAGAKTEHFGYHSALQEEFGLLPSKSRPYYDIYKLIGFSLHSMAASQNPAFEQCWPIMGFFGLRDRQAVIDWLVKARGEYFSLKDDAEKVGYCLTKDLEGVLVCLPEHASTLFDFLEYVEVQFPQVWTSKVKGAPIMGQKVLQCGADCLDFHGSVKSMTTNRAPSNLMALGDLRHVVRYRNSIQQRGDYFANKFPSSKYGERLQKEVQQIDDSIRQSYSQILPAMTQQIMTLGEKVKAEYGAIGYPIQYYDNKEFSMIADDLVRYKGFVDRMQTFAKAHQEFKEFVEAEEDMATIAGVQQDANVQNYISTQITPLFQAFDNSRGELRGVLMNTPIPNGFRAYIEDMLAILA